MPARTSQGQLRVPVESLIIRLRGEGVILDSDLAGIYGVETGALNRAVKRNLERFPKDFGFQLTAEEAHALRCQSGISKTEAGAGLMKAGRGGRRYLPYAFTEHGALMAANVLNSPRAVQMSVFVVRAFIRMRAALGDTRELARKLAAPSPTPPKTSAARNRLPRRRGGAGLPDAAAAARVVAVTGGLTGQGGGPGAKKRRLTWATT